MTIRDRAMKDRNWFEKMITKIPGFKGYYNRELRRDADKLQREFITGKLESARENINRIIRKNSEKGNLSLLNGYDNLMKELDRCISGVKYSDRGYSGFFDLVKIREDTLDDVYRIEFSLLENAEALLEYSSSGFQKDDAGKTVENMEARIREVMKTMKERESILTGFSGGEETER